VYLRELEAAKLRREGLPVKAIAQRLEADVESVKRWIEKRG
jgi:transposase